MTEEQAKNYAASKYNPGSAAEAVAIEAYKVGFNNGRQEALEQAYAKGGKHLDAGLSPQLLPEVIAAMAESGETPPLAEPGARR